MNEHTAIAQLKQGDIRGLEVLVRKYQLDAVRAAFAIVKDKGAAEEIVQDAFIRVYQRIAQFDETRPFRPWFMRIVVNDAVKLVQNQKRLIPWEDADSAPETAHTPTTPDACLQFEQAEFSTRHDNIEMLHTIFEQLSLEHATVLQLKYYLEMKDDEIAATLEVPVGTVKSRLHAAKRNLRHLLEQLNCVSWDR